MGGAQGGAACGWGLHPSTPRRQAGAVGQGPGNTDPGWRSRGPALSQRTRAQVAGTRPHHPPGPAAQAGQRLQPPRLQRAAFWVVTSPPPALRGPPAQRALEQRQGPSTGRRALSLTGPVSPQGQSPRAAPGLPCLCVTRVPAPPPPQDLLGWGWGSPTDRRMDRQMAGTAGGWIARLGNLSKAEKPGRPGFSSVSS